MFVAPQLTPGEAVAQHPVTAYTLTPEQLHKAEGLHRTRTVLMISDAVLGLLFMLVLIGGRVAPRLERWARGISGKRFVQALVYFPAILLLLGVAELPLLIYGHHVALDYGLSVQGWGSWAGDWMKGQAISLLLFTPVLAGIYRLMERSPRRWWWYGWLISLPIILTLVFLAPVVIDPLYNHFEPLAKTNPELTRQLQSLAHSAGLEIPESRIFLMHASEKVTTYNAYVTGLGATKRIVVWDNTARDMTLGQTLFVFGHETGHYVLHHIYKGMAFSFVLSFIGFLLTKLLADWSIARYGKSWQVAAPSAWGSLPVLLLIASLLSFFGSPLTSAYSRSIEHEADCYGLALTSHITPDSGQVAAQSFQLLGEKSYSYPAPSSLMVFWTYSHPPISDRVRFALEHPAGR